MITRLVALIDPLIHGAQLPWHWAIRGIHYRTSAVVGQTRGRQIGELAVQQYLKPVR